MSVSHEQRHGSLRHHHYHHQHLFFFFYHSLWTLGKRRNCHMTRASCCVSKGLCIVWSDRRDNGCPPWTEKKTKTKKGSWSSTQGEYDQPGEEGRGWGDIDFKKEEKNKTKREFGGGRGRLGIPYRRAQKPERWSLTAHQSKGKKVYNSQLALWVHVSQCIKTNYYQPLDRSSTLGQVGTVPWYIKKKKYLHLQHINYFPNIPSL